MKYTIKNLTNSPYTVPGAKGPVHVPARGEATGNFDALQIAAIRGVGYFQVTEAGPAESKFAEAKAEETRFPDDETKPVKRGPGRPKKAD